MKLTIKTNGGPLDVIIEDEKVEQFIEKTNGYTDENGHHPNHIIDYCQIAYQMYLDDKLSEDEYNHIYNTLVKSLQDAA